MHRHVRLMGLVVGLTVALFSQAPALARPQGDPAGEAARDIWGVRDHGSPGPRSRDQRAPVIVTGSIRSLGHVTPKGTKTRFRSLTLATDKGPVQVVLAPPAALLDVEDRLAKGQTVTVTGLPRGRKDARHILAQSLAFPHGPTLDLRDQAGHPLWTEGPRR